jgi:Nucleoside-diphosphate-sugar epimerases
MQVLITGGAGFIGSHLAEAYLAHGDEVWIMDDLSTGGIRNVEHLRNHPRFHYLVETVMNVPVLAESIDRVDAVIHLAAAVGVRLIVESPVNTIETNIKGTENVLMQASKKKKKVFIASTSEVYGKSARLPFKEDDDLVLGPTTKGRWSYACSKALDEFLAIAYWKERKVPVVIARLFNTVGPRQTGRYGMVIPTFVRQALGGSPITVFGDGTQSRSFTYVSDVVKAILGLVDSDQAVGQVFNIGNGKEITILDLANLVKGVAGSASEIVTIPYDQAYEEGFEDMPRRVPDISKIRKAIGYEPTLGIRAILEKVVEYEKKQGIFSQNFQTN